MVSEANLSVTLDFGDYKFVTKSLLIEHSSINKLESLLNF